MKAQELHDKISAREDKITRQHILDAINYLESALTGNDSVEQLDSAIESAQTARARLTR